VATELTDTLDSIEIKLRLLLTKTAQLTELNATLVEQNRILTDDNRKLRAEAILRQSDMSHLKTQLTTYETRQQKERAYNQDLRQEIDQYIAQIDACIGKLQQF
jgi:regulator of replication initiation timing